MEKIDTSFKYVDVLNRLKTEMLHGDKTLDSKMNRNFVIANAKLILNMVEALIRESEDNFAHVGCISGAVISKLYKNISSAEYKSFSEFIDAAINRCDRDEVIKIPKSDTDKIGMISAMSEIR